MSERRFHIDLSFALELLSTASATEVNANGETAVDVLLRGSMSTEPIVREGAIYGMAGHASDHRVRARLIEMSTSDERPGIRTAASETLE